MNLIYSSEATIEEYKNELVIYREKFSELNNNPGAIYNSDMVEVKNRLNMVEGRIISSIKVSPSEVALSN